MRKYFSNLTLTLTLIILLFLAGGVTAQYSMYKHLIGVQDIYWATGGTGAVETFTYTDPVTGYTLTMDKVDATNLKFRTAIGGISKSVEALVNGDNSINLTPNNVTAGGTVSANAVSSTTTVAAGTNITAGGNITATGNLAGVNLTATGTTTLSNIPVGPGATPLVCPAGTPTNPTATEVGYLSGVTSGIQSQIDNIAAGNANFLPDSFTKLKVYNNSGTPATQIDITCAAVVVTDSGGDCKIILNVSHTVDCTTTGANALDTGSLAQGWYYFYIIADSSGNNACLASASASAPTLPGSYTHTKQVSAIYYTGSTFRNVRQIGRQVYCLNNALDVTGAINSSSWASRSMANYVPTIALTAQLQPISISTNGYLTFAIAWDSGGNTNKRNFSSRGPYLLDSLYVALSPFNYLLNPSAPQTIYVKSYNSSDLGHLYLSGYELDI